MRRNLRPHEDTPHRAMRRQRQEAKRILLVSRAAILVVYTAARFAVPPDPHLLDGSLEPSRPPITIETLGDPCIK